MQQSRRETQQIPPLRLWWSSNQQRQIPMPGCISRLAAPVHRESPRNTKTCSVYYGANLIFCAVFVVRRCGDFFFSPGRITFNAVTLNWVKLIIYGPVCGKREETCTTREEDLSEYLNSDIYIRIPIWSQRNSSWNNVSFLSSVEQWNSQSFSDQCILLWLSKTDSHFGARRFQLYALSHVSKAIFRSTFNQFISLSPPSERP